MTNKRIDTGVLRDPSWWHWTATAPLLAASLSGVAWALPVAVALSGGMSAGYYAYLRSWRPFPVQIRLAFLAMLFAGAVPYMAWLHAVQMAGTTAMISVGYCPLARMLMLAPWNRIEPFSAHALWQAFVVVPRAGGLLRGSAAPASAVGASCSLHAHSCRTRVTNVEAPPSLAT